MEITRRRLDAYTSFKIGGEALYGEVSSIEGLRECVLYAHAENLRIHILGGGTNTYFGEDLTGLLVIKNEIKGIEMRTSDSQTVRQSDKNDTIVITVGAGEIWDDVVLFAVEHGYWGIENLSYIPGAVGAAPVQNIGAYGVELADVFESLVAFDNETLNEVTFSKSMCEFGYRDSLFKRTPGRYVIVSVTLRLSKKPNPILTYKPLDALMSKEELLLNDIRQKVIEIRKAKLPDWKIYPNAGSFFKNPVLTEVEAEGFRLVYPTCPIHQADEGGYKVPAAWLIEHVAHAKGLRIGDVGTWPNQPLVIVNYGNAHADDVTLFAATISKTIQDVTGIILEPEVRRVP